MISAIGAFPARQAVSTSSTSLSSPTSSCGSSPAGTTCLPESDLLSLSQPGSLTSSVEAYQQTSLKILVRSATTATDDGAERVMAHARLRFCYDFVAADGTNIRIRAQANLDYSQFSDSDDGSQWTRLQAKARVSVLQENVSSDIAPLLETPDISTEAREIVSQALDLFQQVVGATTSAFLGSDPLDGDSLIAGIVDAFNGLTASIDSLFPPPATDLTAVPTGNGAELLAQATADPSAVLASASLPAETTQVVPDESVMMRVRLRVIQSLSSIVDAFDADSSGQQAFRSMVKASAEITARFSVTGADAHDGLLQAAGIDTQA